SVKNVAAEVIELDEIWDFVGRKNKTKERLGYMDDSGDSWTWLAIDSKSKLVLSHAVGGRNESTYDRFMKQLSAATTGNCQITSDGLPLYRSVPFYFGTRCSFSQLTKIYAASPAETRYSPAKIIGTE